MISHVLRNTLRNPHARSRWTIVDGQPWRRSAWGNRPTATDTQQGVELSHGPVSRLNERLLLLIEQLELLHLKVCALLGSIALLF